MIVSYRHKFILVGGSKIASTTSHVVFKNSGILGPDDIITALPLGTSLDPNEDASRNLPPISYTDFIGKVLTNPINTIPGVDGKQAQPDQVSRKIFIPTASNEEYLQFLMNQLARNLTPREIMNYGMVTREQLDEYEIYCFIRDPIQRYLSWFFFDLHIKKQRYTLEALMADIDNIDPSYGPRNFQNKRYRDYCEFVEQPFLYENFEKEMRDLVKWHGGRLREIPKIKGDIRPAWSKDPVEDWLPRTYIDKLKVAMWQDVQFYNEVKHG